MAWVEDPSNTDLTQLRARLRALRADPDGTGSATAALIAEADTHGRHRHVAEVGDAEALAGAARIHPEGFAVLTGSLPAAALAALIGMLGGARRPPAVSQVAALAAAPHPATLAGVRLSPAGRLGHGGRGPGLLLSREEAAMAPAVAARKGAIWDGRFRLVNDDDGTIGAWGCDAPRDRRMLPGVVLRTLPALRRHGRVVAGGADLWQGPSPLLVFSPKSWATGAGFCRLHPFS
jgi:tRNA(Ile)-lysidine synthase